mmetsp:Transcript_3402/g.4919  ORF Transcript_3402/g.4919 Transcript_3402/m.4919 type:complete len:543 (+) Transcript_3402:1-1629(+)
MDIAPNSGIGISKEDSDFILSKLRASAKAVDTHAPYVEWSHYESAFLYVSVGLSTKDLNTTQRLYLPLLLELAFKLPAKLDDGSTIVKDDFVSELNDDTVRYSAGCGLSGSRIPQMISFAVQIENSDGQGFATAVKWIRRVLFLTTLSTESIKMAVQRLLSEIPPQIRHGPTVCGAVSSELNYDPDISNQIAKSALRQGAFLAELLKRIEEGNEGEKVLEELEEIKREVTKQKNMQVFVAGNLKEIPEPVESLTTGLSPPGAGSSYMKCDLMTDVSASAVRSNSSGQAVVCSLSAIESSFLGITAPGVGVYDPNHASLLVTIEYLTALEGDFWVKLRGAGLTYGSSISNSTESKILKFGLFKCTDVAGAFAAATQILVDYASGNSTISNVGLESAKSSLAYNIISGVSTKLSAATDAWVGSYLGEKVDYNQWLLSKIAEVTTDDAMHALVTYLIPLFDPKSNLSVACPTNKAEEISEYFAQRGWTDVKNISEDKLCDSFVHEQESKGDDAKICLPTTVNGVSMFMPGAFAAQFQCGCPKCGR